MGNGLNIQKDKLKDEIEKLKHEYKIELPKKISEARAYGDLRENAEYDSARERQAFVKARITQLTEQLSRLNNIDIANLKRDRIGYGSSVVVIDRGSGDRVELTFVSTHEVNPAEGKISLASPIGIALNNRAVGEEVEITIPAGKKKYYIEKLTTIHGDEHEVKSE
jgi:transcription elongation factor GreA